MIREMIPADEILAKAHAVGQYYGFSPLSVFSEASRGGARPKAADVAFTANAISALALDPVAETVASFLKQCRQASIAVNARQPLFIWHTNIAHGRPAQKKAVVQFHALGSERALADVVIIRALLALTRDLYHEEPVVRINSMGDRETRARYARELTTFFKKRAGSLSEECLTRAKHNVFEAAEIAITQKCEDLPAPSEHLSDASRKRFEDLLEYLEMTETPYEFARTLISRGNAWNDTCFELVIGDRRIAWGSRYHELTRHFFSPGTMQATGAVFQIVSGGPVVKKVSPVRHRFSFVHIGDEAKRLSLKLAEDFREARVPLVQDIGVESLSEQFALAERRNSPYLLIMGRKEALEGSTILRNRVTQEEHILPLKGLIDRLKAFA